MGFSFNGTTSQSMGLATRITNEYRMPDLRNNTITMPGRHGVFDFGETVSERKILISCFIPPGKTDEQFLSKKDDIIEWLNPDNGLCQLILDKEPDECMKQGLHPDSPLTGQSVIPAPLIWNFSAQTLMAMPYQTRPLILRKPEPLPRLALLGISSPTRSTP
mgnify:CR=1 FL=1